MKREEYLVPEQEQGSFMHGFTLGVVVGAMGYFLFATEKGLKVRKQLVNEWQEAKKNLVEQGVIDDKNLSLREFIYSLFQKFTGNEDSVGGGSVSQGLLANTSVSIESRPKRMFSRNKSKKEVTKKFRGI